MAFSRSRTSTGQAFEESDLDLLSTLAASLSVALENARLVEEIAADELPSWRS